MAASAASSPSLDVLTCTSKELYDYLFHHRFDKDSTKTKKFLTNSAAAEENNATTTNSAATEEEEADLGTPLRSTVTMSCLVPRGKFQITLYENALIATNAKNQKFRLSYSGGSEGHVVQRLICYPRPEDCRNYQPLKQQDVVLFVLQSPVTFGKKTYNQISLTLPKDDNTSTDDWLALMQEALGRSTTTDDDNGDGTSSVILPITRIYHPRHPSAPTSIRAPFLSFQDANSSSTSAGMPFLACYHGVKDGVLFPLKEGILFTKPPTFWPRSIFSSIACGRGTNSNASRYVDLVLQLEEEGSNNEQQLLEFTNISRQEQPCLNDYIHNVLIPAMKQDAAGGDDAAVVEEEEVVDDDDDDNNTEDDDSSNENESRRRRTTKRKAASAAREATKSDMKNAHLGNNEENDDDDDDDDDDDEAFQMSTNREDGDDDDDDEDTSSNDDEEEDDEEEESDEEDIADAQVVEDGDATESEEDEPPSKKAKQMDRLVTLL